MVTRIVQHAIAATLPVGRYLLKFEAIDPVQLPNFAGSAWRGAFGHALKKLVCVTRESSCAECILYRSCVYPYLFETPPDPAVGKMRKYTAAPHPYVLIPDSHAGVVRAGATVRLGVTLFGHGNRQLPYVVHALARAAQLGIGRNRGRLQLQSVEQATENYDWAPIYVPGERIHPLPASVPPAPSCPESLLVTLNTPLRLRRNDRYVTPEEFDFCALFPNLLRRISLLTAFHTDSPLEANFAELVQKATTVSLHRAHLRWQEWTRYSSRQNTTLQMGGLVGHFSLRGADVATFWPYLWLGQWTHAGKGTSMGLGRYAIMPN